MSEQDHDAERMHLSDEAAQRLLARVVELDADRHIGTTVARLREVTRELGIPDATFERALEELRMLTAATPGTQEVRERPQSRWWWQRSIRSTTERSGGESLFVNGGVLAAFIAALGLSSYLSHFLGGDWQMRAGFTVLLNLLAVVVARRYRARPAMYLLAVTAVAQSVEYVMHLLFGIQAVQGGDTHWAVLAAAAVALLCSPWLRAPGPNDGVRTPAEEVEREPIIPPSEHRRRWWELWHGVAQQPRTSVF